MKKSLFFMIGLVLLSNAGEAQYYKDVDKNGRYNSPELNTSNKLLECLYLVGDAGELDDEKNQTNYVIENLKNRLSHESISSSVVFLGDNIYPSGMPSKKSEERSVMEAKMNAQLNLAENYDQPVVFIPGNHDWNKSKKGGLDAVKRQEKYLENYFADRHVKMYPGRGCGDPKKKKINKDLVYVYIDSEWWLTNWNLEKDINEKCDISSRGDFLKAMEEIFAEHKNDIIVLLSHHPFRSNGVHGGHFSWKHHIFPLHETKLGHIPLPIIGSMYPIYRSVTGSSQDIPNKKYKELIQGVEKAAAKFGAKLIVCSGHDHSLQFFEENDVQYIISGSGAKTSFASKGNGAYYSDPSRGYAKLLFYENMETWVEYYTVDSKGQESLSFRKQIRESRLGSLKDDHNYPPLDEVESFTTIAANADFAANKFKSFWLGEQYRNLWTTEVKARNINLEKELGGLTPIKKGGGMASNSLRMETSDGKHYILRSIKKDYTKLVPPEFADLDLIDIIADQNSASHPYGAMVLPKLSKAAGIYYTNPKLVYLNHQRGLGNYNSQFSEELYLLEERPNGDWSDATHFGNASHIISYLDLLDILRNKKKHFVDQKWVLKSRLFDLWVHDWDRHDDQWRWAHFEEDDRHIYRPIPRDRDQVFYKFQGVIPGLIGSLGIKKFKDFKHQLKDAKNQSFNARYFDRFFMNELDWPVWEESVINLQNSISNVHISEALNDLPAEIEESEKEYIASRLYSRRDDMMRPARELYEFISKEVQVAGTDDANIFDINYLPRGNLHVKMWVNDKKETEILKFDRIFDPEVTNEVRLFGLRGKDHFQVHGDGPTKIRVRIIGGEGDDHVQNISNSARVVVYDTPEGMKTEGKISDKRSYQTDVNEFDRKTFRYNTGAPGILLGATQDEGFWFGGSYTWTNYKWRKEPFASRHQVKAQLAPFAREAYLASYRGEWSEVIGSVGIETNLSLRSPWYENYFGLGNGSKRDLDRPLQFNWVRIRNRDALLALKKLSKNGRSNYYFGPHYQQIELENVVGRVLDQDDSGFESDDFDQEHYLGMEAGFQFYAGDEGLTRLNGLSWKADGKYMHQLDDEDSFFSFSSRLKFYLQLSTRPQLVLANQVVFSALFGEGNLIHYPALGNNNGLRGYRDFRYRGDRSFANNTDIRMHLFQWRNSIIPLKVGVTAGFDVGRVWNNEAEPEFGRVLESEEWHSSILTGLTLNILDLLVIHPYVGFSEDQTQFSLLMGYSF